MRKIFLALLIAVFFSSSCLAIDANQTVQAQEVYYGTLRFFSWVLAPFLTLVLVLVVVGVIMLFGKLVRNIAD